MGDSNDDQVRLPFRERESRRPRRYERPAGRQGRGSGGDDERGAARATRVDHHYRSLQCILRFGRKISRGNVGAGTHSYAPRRTCGRQEVRRSLESTPRLSAFGSKVLYARDDGHRS
jgi:hypothetical protein